MRTTTFISLLFAFSLVAEAQQPVRYVVELQSTPALAFHQRSRAAAADAVMTTHGERAQLDAAVKSTSLRNRLAAEAEDDAVVATPTTQRPSPAEQAMALAVIQREHATFDAQSALFGFRSIRHLTHVTNVVIVEGPPGSEEALRRMPGVKRVGRERIYHKTFDASIGIHQIDSAWAAIPGATYNRSNPTAWNNAGQGVKIGLVDTGVDATHPAFSQNSMRSQMTMPPNFPKWSSETSAAATYNQGIVNTAQNKIIVARSYGGQGAVDVDGHGTAVAQVAAGFPIAGCTGASCALATPNGMNLSGVAPAAWLGIYDVDSALTGSYTDSDILAALDDCGNDGMDIVSMSFGAPDYGGLADPIDQEYNDAFTTLVNLGVVLFASAGNDGPDPYTISAPAVDPNVIAVGAQQSTSLYGNAHAIASGTTISAAAADNNTSTIPTLVAPLADVRNWDSTGLGCGTANSGVATGKILVIQRGSCNFTVKVLYALTAGAAGVIVYNAAAPSDGSDPNSLVTMLLDTASNPAQIANFPSIFVGYNDGITLLGNLTSSVTANFGLQTGDIRQVADFSGRGPESDLAIKPELVAVGNSIITAYCTDLTDYPTSNQCSPFGYLFWDGTSFSSPLAAGAAAVIKSARPNLFSTDYRSLLVDSASAMVNPAGVSWPVQTVGAGSLDLLRGVQSSVSVNPATLSFGTTGSSLATSQQLTLRNVTTSSKTYRLSFEGMAAGLPSTPVTGVTVSWGGGSFTVFFPNYNISPGFYTSQVAVTPDLSVSTVTIAPGQTANVGVTMPTSGLSAGAYQGFIDVTTVGNSAPDARVPYWYAVPAAAPTAIAFDVSPLYISAGSTQSMIMRFVDTSGVLFAAPGTIIVTNTGYGVPGPAFLSTPYQAYSGSVTFPNVWLVDISIPSDDPGGITYTFQVTCGSVTGTFTVISQ